MTTQAQIKFFRYTQSNIRGYFKEGPRTLKIYATDRADADAQAEAMGADLEDRCPCCGRRWTCWSDDGELLVSSAD